MILIMRGDYDQLAEISKGFDREANRVKTSIDRLNRQVEVLQGGDWIGEGANAFYREMQSEVMPAMQRLLKALEFGSRVTRTIVQLLEEAERTIAGLFARILSAFGVAIAVVGIGGLGATAGEAGGAAGAAGGGGGAAGSEPETTASGGGGGGAGGGAGGGGGGGGGGGSWDGEIGFQQEKPSTGKPPARPRRR